VARPGRGRPIGAADGRSPKPTQFSLRTEQFTAARAKIRGMG
jgi:hypothetical protein